MKKTLSVLLIMLLAATTASGVVLREEGSLLILEAEDEPLSAILVELSRRYSFEIDFGGRLLQQRVTTRIRRQPLEQVIARLLQNMESRNYIIYYDAEGQIRKIKFLKVQARESPKKAPPQRGHGFRRVPEGMPPLLPADLPPTEEMDQTTKGPSEGKTYRAEKDLKRPYFLPPRRPAGE